MFLFLFLIIFFIINNLSIASKSLWDKKAKNGELNWLPLTVHLSDCAEVAKKLFLTWLPEGAKQVLINGTCEEGEAEKLLIFLAAAHDVGKGTPFFQAKKSFAQELDERLLSLQLDVGLIFPGSDKPFANEISHGFASQVLLEQGGCNSNAAVIIGAHHGKPPNNVDYKEDMVQSYPRGFHV